MEYIAFDAPTHYTLASVAQADGQLLREERIEHERGARQAFLARGERGSPGAVETVGNWSWIVDEIDAAGCRPKLVHARKAKLIMGQINKTDKLDARGLTGHRAIEVRSGRGHSGTPCASPTVPPRGLGDESVGRHGGAR